MMHKVQEGKNMGKKREEDKISRLERDITKLIRLLPLSALLVYLEV